MQFQTLFKYNLALLPKDFFNIEFHALKTDSRAVEEGDVFLALDGYQSNGHSFIKDALAKGAFIIKNEHFHYDGNEEELRRIISVPNTASVVAILSKAFFDDPDNDLTIIGITGTNGKTSTSFMIEHCLTIEKQWKMGLIGTIHNRIGEEILPSINTTPDAFTLYSMLDKMRKAGCQAVVLEISSHALTIGRTNALALDVAIFTNISPEHLDFHKDMAEYTRSKLRLFELLNLSPKKHKAAIFPKDSELADKIHSSLDLTTTMEYTYQLQECFPVKGTPVNQISAMIQKIDLKHTKGLLFQGENAIAPFDIPLPGIFNVQNFLGALLCAHHFGIGWESTILAMQDVQIPGRFQNISPVSHPFSIIIDYAHTPDALDNVLQSARALQPKKIVLVFGCGGDRDKTKRPLMGKIASQWADQIIITSDNPRSEDPFLILEDITRGIPPEYRERISTQINRKKAIEQGLEALSEGDIMIIAGKGHEEYQIFRHRTISFSDRQIVLDILATKEEVAWN